MADCKVKIKVVEWDDRDFVAAIDGAWQGASAQASDVDAFETAQRAQDLLRGSGFPTAVIEYSRSVDEAMSHIAHWTVRRQ